MNIHRLGHLAMLLFLSIIQISCSGWSTRDHGRTITIGYGGGVTGGVQGYSIDDNGSLRKWRASMTGQRTTDTITRTTNDSAYFYFRYLDDIDFSARQLNTTGDLTTFVEMDNGNGTKNTVRWGGGTGPCDLTTFFTMLSTFSQHHERH